MTEKWLHSITTPDFLQFIVYTIFHLKIWWRIPRRESKRNKEPNTILWGFDDTKRDEKRIYFLAFPKNENPLNTIPQYKNWFCCLSVILHNFILMLIFVTLSITLFPLYPSSRLMWMKKYIFYHFKRLENENRIFMWKYFLSRFHIKKNMIQWLWDVRYHLIVSYRQQWCV